MTARGFYTLLFGACLLITAMSVSAPGAFLLGVAALLAFAVSLVSVLFAVLTCRIRQEVTGLQAVRGGVCRYMLRVFMIAPLPIAPLSLTVTLPSGKRSEFALSARLFGTTQSENEFPCPHVGVFPVGVVHVVFSDCFGLFRFRSVIKEPAAAVTVLPVPRDTAPLKYSPGEGETTAAQRSLADRTTPTDTRVWQEGDELGRVHWKLSMRRQELMVHTYETPQRPDALVLLDFAPPPAEGAARARMVDALTETAAGVLKTLLDAGRIARLPIEGDAHRELSGQAIEALDPMLHALAQETFLKPTDFTRVLMAASRRMRRTGSTAIITARLTPQIADAVIALGRMGPHTSLMLITPGAPDERQEKLLYLLRASGIDAAAVRA